MQIRSSGYSPWANSASPVQNGAPASAHWRSWSPSRYGSQPRTDVAGAARECEHTIDAELGCEQDRLAKIGRVAVRKRTVRVQRVAPRVQCGDPESALFDALPPAL